MTQNLVLIQGRVGQDPELRSTRSGTSVCNVSIATEYSQKVDGEWKKNTVWHRVTCFGSIADFVGKYAKKGSAIGVSGHLSYSEYDNEGTKVYQTSIIVDEVTTLVAHSGQSGQERQRRYGNKGATALPENQDGINQDYNPDEIPF